MYRRWGGGVVKGGNMRGTRGQCLQKCAKGRNFFVKKSGGGIRWSMKVGLGGVEREDSRRVKLRGWVVGGLGRRFTRF